MFKEIEEYCINSEGEARDTENCQIEIIGVNKYVYGSGPWRVLNIGY
jgi:hypothetical protein